jgi:hypothetical protein
MLLAHKIELRPMAAQQEYLDKACGTKRHCYNQLLEHFSKKENPFSLKAAYDFYKNVIREQFEVVPHCLGSKRFFGYQSKHHSLKINLFINSNGLRFL